MKFSRTAKNKWLAACLFSVTVLAGFQLQHVDAHAEQPQAQTQTQPTGNSAPANGSVSGVMTGSFGTQPGHTVTLQSASSTATSATTQTDSNQPTPSPEVPTTPQTPPAPNNGTPTSNSGAASTTQGSSAQGNTTNQQPAQTTEPTGTSGTSVSTQGSTTSSPNVSQMGQLEVNAIDGVTGTKIAGNTFTGEYQGTVGSSIKDKSILVTPIPGYSYVGNVDKDIPDTFVKTPQTANLAYMQLSPIVVHYVDVTDPSNVLWTYSLPTNMAAKGQVYDTDDSQLQFAGYTFDHDSGNTTGLIDQTVKSYTDLNPIVVNYYYQPKPGQAETVNTADWIVTSETTPIGLTGEYSFSLYLKRDQSAPIKVGSYDNGQAGSGHTTVTIGGSTTTTGTTNTDSSSSNNNGTSTTTITTTETTDSTVETAGSTATTLTGNSSSLTTTPISVSTSPVATPTATVNIVTETGNPLSQLTISGKSGTNVRTQIQQRLNDLRQNGYVILSNDVKGNTTLNQTNPVMTIKVSHPARQANPFKHATMPIVAQLGNASQSVKAAAQSVKGLSQTATQASSIANTVTNSQNATNQVTTNQTSNSQLANDQSAQNSTSQTSDSSSNNSNSGQADQNMTQQNQKITQNTATSQATSKDAEGNSQVHRDVVANNGQSFGHSAANNGSGGHSVSGLAAYFISLSGKINLGARG